MDSFKKNIFLRKKSSRMTFLALYFALRRNPLYLPLISDSLSLLAGRPLGETVALAALIFLQITQEPLKAPLSPHWPRPRTEAVPTARVTASGAGRSWRRPPSSRCCHRLCVGRHNSVILQHTHNPEPERKSGDGPSGSKAGSVMTPACRCRTPTGTIIPAPLHGRRRLPSTSLMDGTSPSRGFLPPSSRKELIGSKLEGN